MKKINLTDEELEMMNYNDIAHVILEHNNSKMKTMELFKEVCKLLNLSESEYEEYVADFFELLSTDKRFIMLEQGYWDLKIKHNKGMVIESDDDEDEDEIPLDDEVEESSEDEEEDFEADNNDDDIEDDDLSDLVIIDDSEDENN